MSTQGVSSGGGEADPCRVSPGCEPLNAAEAGQLASIFKALADPVRLRLLSLIACRSGDVAVGDLTAAFEVTSPTISHHLKVLREAGLIGADRRGTWIHYRIIPDVLSRLAAFLSPSAGGDGALAPAIGPSPT